MRLPHPIVLLGGAVLVAALLTWILPAGQYDRRDDPATGRRVVVAGTFHPVERAPVGPWAAVVAIPRGFIAGSEIIFLVLFSGGAWVIVDRLGTLPAVVGWLVDRFSKRGLWVIALVSIFFGVMGALENMEEEIIPLVPALMALGAGLGVDAVTVVAMSMGAAMAGAAFGPTNPFQAGIALKVAQLPPLGLARLRFTMLVVGLLIWIAVTMIHAVRHRRDVRLKPDTTNSDGTNTGSVRLQADRVRHRMTPRHALIFAIVIAPLAAYIYGSLKLDWGLNELAAGFFLAGIVAGVVGGFGLTKTVNVFLEGMATVLMASAAIGIARSISMVLDDGRVVDTILHAMVMPLEHLPAFASVLLMIPAHMLIHIPVPSASGQAVLTMPLFAPIGDLLGYSREATVIAYQTGNGLAQMMTPTNGALMAILLAAGVPLQRWLRFALVGIALLVVVGVVAAAVAM